MRLFVITLLCVSVIGVHSDGHTLRYYYTGVSDKGSDLPDFSIVGYVDEHEFMNYNSDSHLARPVTRWMEKNEGPEYWDRETQNLKGTEPVFRHNVRTVMSRFNQTGGIHIVQWMYGCELRDDGTTEGYDQDGYDGRDFMSLDTQRGIYIPTMNEAQITAQRWNSPEMREGERQKNYLENICIPALKKYIEYGREDLERRVRPEVKVWGHRQSDDVTRLQCLVYGFHPRPVEVKWMRNGKDHLPSDEMSPILPHPDGTYQIRVSVEVPTKEADTYSCHVDHSSLEEVLTKKYEPDNGTQYTMIIAIACAVVIIAVILGVGIFCYKKKGKGYKTTSTSDASSDSSSNPKA
ncbi:class I histocompatibility antigen, F10 alpha chain-like isoform X3 [Aquarana catesbeiana]|uniref:class I histocompatibility antigen, F10 alpha chain-like isoform X3 n=1 Tax=Aquarana catesbeiana TaxID=8400 RepID=UPI003CC9B7EB